MRFCASKDDKNSKPLLAPSWGKSKKLRFTFMLPRLTSNVLSKWSTMYSQLQVAVHDLLMAAVTGPSPTKSALKKKTVDLANENGALTALNADLQSTIDGKVCT